MRSIINILFFSAIIFTALNWSFSNDEWGFYGHRVINHHAVFTCPPPLVGFYKEHIEYITEHAVDPDKRRHASIFESIKHYIDIDHWDRFPFRSVPRTYQEAIIKYGELIVENAEGVNILYNVDIKEDTIDLVSQSQGVISVHKDTFMNFFNEHLFPHRYSESFKTVQDASRFFAGGTKSLEVKDSFSLYGILPYSMLEIHYRLVSAFEREDLGAILKLSADYGHYIADAHVPLHTTENYNGQLTGQEGIHAFWESRIPELFAEEQFDYFVGKAEYVEDLVTYLWDIVLDSHAELDKVLGEELKLRNSFPLDLQYCFDDRNGLTVRLPCPEYAQAYQNALEGMVEERFRSSIKSVGDLWYTAWVQAGRPDLGGKVMDMDEVAFDTLRYNGKILGRPH